MRILRLAVVVILPFFLLGAMCGVPGGSAAPPKDPLDGNWRIVLGTLISGSNPTPHLGNCITISQSQVTSILIAGPQNVLCSTPGRITESRQVSLDGNQVTVVYLQDQTGTNVGVDSTILNTFVGTRASDGNASGVFTIDVTVLGVHTVISYQAQMIKY